MRVDCQGWGTSQYFAVANTLSVLPVGFFCGRRAHVSLLAPFFSHLAHSFPLPTYFLQILRQFEALCRNQLPSKNLPSVGDHSVPARTVLKLTEDLLTDPLPFAAETVLKPTSLLAPPSQAPNLFPGDTCLSEGQVLDSLSSCQPDLPPASLSQEGPESRHPDADAQEDRPQRGDPDGTVSLFAGMELVAPSSQTLVVTGAQKDVAPLPRTASCPGSTKISEDNRETSVFSFLNV